MFERFTEKARRVIFFARYEASSLGTPYIDTQHLLLGLLREDKSLIRQVLPNLDYESARQDMAERVGPKQANVPTSVDLPLAEDAENALKYAMEEADRLNSKHIDTGHLLLGLLHNSDFESAKFLSRFGANLGSLRKRVEALRLRTGLTELESPSARTVFPAYVRRFAQAPGSPPPDIIEIHGKKWFTEIIQQAVTRLTSDAWLWERKLWQPRDVVYEKNGKRLSFDLTLAQDTEKFLLVKNGWKKDNCAICRWELFESNDPAHGTGFTNGRDWICEECHTRFIANDFFASPYSDFT